MPAGCRQSELKCGAQEQQQQQQHQQQQKLQCEQPKQYSLEQHRKMTLDFIRRKESLDVVAFLTRMNTNGSSSTSSNTNAANPSWVPQWLDQETWADPRKKAYLRSRLFFRSVKRGCIVGRTSWNASSGSKPTFEVDGNVLKSKGLVIDTISALTTTYTETEARPLHQDTTKYDNTSPKLDRKDSGSGLAPEATKKKRTFSTHTKQDASKDAARKPHDPSTTPPRKVPRHQRQAPLRSTEQIHPEEASTAATFQKARLYAKAFNISTKEAGPSSEPTTDINHEEEEDEEKDGEKEKEEGVEGEEDCDADDDDDDDDEGPSPPRTAYPGKSGVYMALFHLLNYHLHLPVSATAADDDTGTGTSPPNMAKEAHLPFACEHIAFLSLFANLDSWRTIKARAPDVSRWVKLNREFPIKHADLDLDLESSEGEAEDEEQQPRQRVPPDLETIVANNNASLVDRSPLVLCEYLRHPRKELYEYLRKKHLSDPDVHVAFLRTRHILGFARRLAITRRAGYLGWVPASAREGDVVALLAGCTVPVVLRRTSRTSSSFSSGDEEASDFVVVGDAHFHGLMDGEGMRGRKRVVDQWEWLHIH